GVRSPPYLSSGARRRRSRHVHADGSAYTAAMAEELRISERPSLRRPILICAFRGWNDGGQGASMAASFLSQSLGAERFAEIDPEEFFDFQVTRPHVSLVEGTTRRVDWPAA